MTSTATDIVPPSTRRFDFRHPYVDGLALDITLEEARTVTCRGSLIDYPRALILRWELHSSKLYAELMDKFYDGLVGNLTYMTTRSAKELDPALMAAQAREKGWRLVGYAYHGGSLVLGGPQASHLLQNPETLECMVTFRGSMSTRDYLADADVRKVDFCGFENEFHKGFRDHFRLIAQSEGWQNSIRPAMPSCSRLYSTGHSLGGAKATFFAACVQKAPQPGEPGYDSDFSHISWTQGRPTLLPEYEA